MNAFLGRIFWDFLGEKYWANVVSKKIQMKLSKIRVGAHPSSQNPEGRGFFFFLMSLHLTDVSPSYLTVQLPYVMNELTLTELDMGFSIPKILHASAPSVDHQGRKISYKGWGMFMLSGVQHQRFQFPNSLNIISILLTLPGNSSRS